jgi:hypothetical protein
MYTYVSICTYIYEGVGCAGDHLVQAHTTWEILIRVKGGRIQGVRVKEVRVKEVRIKGGKGVDCAGDHSV